MVCGALTSSALPDGMPMVCAVACETTASTWPMPIVAYAPTRTDVLCSVPPIWVQEASGTPPSLPMVNEMATSPPEMLRHSASDLALASGVYARKVDGSTPITPTRLPATSARAASTTSTPLTPFRCRTASTSAAGMVCPEATRTCGTTAFRNGATAPGGGPGAAAAAGGRGGRG